MNKPFAVQATHTATGETCYLSGFETVRAGRTRAVSTPALARAKRYSANTSARNLDKWAADTYAKTAFTNFKIITLKVES